MPINWNEVRQKNGVAAAAPSSVSKGINWDEVKRKNGIVSEPTQPTPTPKQPSKLKMPDFSSVLPNKGLTFSKIGEALKNLPSALMKKDVQQATRQPIWDMSSKAARANEVVSEGLGSALIGSEPNKAITTGNEKFDTVLRGFGGIESAFLPGAGGQSFASGIRGASEGLIKGVAAKTGSKVLNNPYVQRAAIGAAESVPYTAHQIASQGLEGKDALKTAALNTAFGVAGELGAEAVGALIKTISSKLKAGKALTQAEVETVKKTPELLALPEAKQYLMLPEGKITTPDVIEALPVKPTTPNKSLQEGADRYFQKASDKYDEAIKKIQNHFRTNELRVDEQARIKSELGIDIDEIVKDLEQAEFYKNNPTEFAKYERSRIAAGVTTPDENKFMNELVTYNEAKENVKYNVPEQYRKETPMTVSRSTIPPKVEGKFAKESFGEQGINKIPRAEPIMPTAKTLPKPVNRVVMDSTKDKFSFKKAWDKFYNSTVDNQSGIAKLSKLAKDDTATLASNSRNAGGTVDYILKDALVDRQGNKIGKSLKEVAEQIPKSKEEDFWNYMSQRHNIDRARENKHVIPNYTSEMSSQAVKEIEALNPAYKSVGDDVTNWIDSFMKEWGVNAGTVDADVYKNLRETYKSYFPTQREFSQLEKSMPDSVRKQFVDNATPIKKATGSDRDINNPLENIMNLVNRNVKTARYNQVGQSMLETVRKAPDKLKELAEIIPTQEGMFANTDNVISVLENGKPVYLRINNKELLEGLKGLPKVVNNAKAMRAFTNAFKGLITQKNPLFAVRNIFRDVPTAYIYGSTKNPVKFGADLAKAGRDILTNSENYQRYRAVGGGGSNFFKGNDVAESAKNLTKKNLNPISGIEKINNITETAPRLAEFNRIFERTGDVQKALDAANNVTVNFARGGNATKAAEPFIPYLNAGVQGLDRFFKAFKDPKTAAATLLKGGIAITAPEIALYMLNKDNPNYQALDNRTKDTYFLIPKEDGTFWKIPKSRELGVLFGSLFQRVMRANDGDKEAFKGFGSSLATGFAPANPIDNNIAAPIYNLKSNKDFAGRSIVPQGMVMDNRSLYLQYDERTTEIAKAIGAYSTKVIDGGLSPKQIDFLIKSYTGVIGQLGMPLATKGASPTKAITTQFTSDPLYSNQALQDFYENYDKLQRSATDKNIVEQLPTNGKKNIVTKEEALRNKFSKASAAISDINKEIKAIEASSAIDKETKIRALRQKILDIAIELNKLK
jgi:hypothetical protein